MLTLIARLFKALNSDSAPGQVAFAFALAMIVGFTPFMSYINLIVLLVALLLKINLSAFILGAAVFSMLGYLLDPMSIALGEALLLNPELNSLWTSLYQNDFLRLLEFNNSLTLGGFLIALAALVPVTWLARMLVIQYRGKVLAWVEKLKIVQMLKASKFYYIYNSLAG